jgi:hypothetical protein
VRPEPGEVVHFSEDPEIEVFVPHVAATSRRDSPYVWAVDGDRAPAYWFPRQCPRVMAWVTDRTAAEDAERIVGPGGGQRVHAIEYCWLDRMRTVRLFAYRLPAADFAPIGGPEPHAHVSTRAVRPLGPPEPVGDLLALHEAAGIQLRILPRLDGLWAAVVASTLEFSGIRLRNAVPPM